MPITKQNSNNLLGLLSCLLAIISVCLTAFNLYLLTWIWSATGGVERTSSWSLNFNGKLQASQPVSSSRVQLIQEHEGHLQISSKWSLHLGPNSLILSGQDKRIKFPDGLKVRSLNSTSAQMSCDPGKSLICHLNSPKLKLTNPNGVDFRQSSIQTPKVSVRRVHSPTNKLHLMSLRQSIRLESLSGRLELYSFGDIHLGSRNSTVILDAKSIELSPQVGHNAPTATDTDGYKLCICLRAAAAAANNQRAAEQPGDETKSINNNGRVFAVKSNLNCFKFTQSFCNNYNYNYNHGHSKQSG